MAMTEGRRLAGVAAAPGVARGPWVHVRRRELPTGGRVAPGAVDAEEARLRDAANRAADDLVALSERVGAEGHEDEAAIFMAHAALAWDPALVDAAVARIRDEGEDGVAAIGAAGAGVAAMLASLDDEVLSARAADVVDVADRIARLLSGLPVEESLLTTPAVIVAEDLSPSLTATLPREHILGIVLEAGSPTAHAAILARAYGIPAVVGCRGILAALEDAGPGAELALDGATGEVVVAPDAATAGGFDARAARFAEVRSHDLEEAALPAVTRDGVGVTLLANIGTPAEAAPARSLGARGVGLFRTEFLYLERSTPPSEDEQAASYREAVEAFGGDPVTIRLLDIGGDKPIPYLPMPAEENPFLGVRALRLAWDRPEIFVTQLRACYRAAVAGPVKVMAPMVADGGDASLLLELAARARDGLAAEGVAFGEVQLGVMLEIPSAILSGDSWFGDVSFASLGTNDLTQYALAVDRGNPALERYRDAMHPAVLRLIAIAAGSAQQAGISLSVCGEMGGDPAAALALVGLGVRQLSMGAASLPAVRRAIRGADAAELRALAAAALGDRSAADARARFSALLPSA
ncbi:MAG TPA: phosphoenolpyruvate--protein phosphotransferase [Candidatus Limnocylindrales bacterium]|nr:phosphoenolpyruvate--protein phosphotransferase [Candidatus Limnocylindrales bacterium]